MRFCPAVLVGLAIGVALPTAAEAQAEPAGRDAPDSLTVLMTRLDRELFDRANAHDLPGLMALFAPDLEFYHDKGGLQHWKDVEAGFRSIFEQNNGMHRELVAGSLEVYPIPNYGAMEAGRHRFCHQEKGKEECAVFKFVQIWRQDSTGWKVTRVVSYGH
ncbi:MAG TPA: nuclear transport factor 2 family protein, partial [Gemmatimonadales bacterium]|nr:nuclear transport factor 2 family protein [Gemmatimonadales bacterium]